MSGSYKTGAGMGAGLIIAGSITVMSIFGIVFDYWYKNAKDRRARELEKLKYQKEILELELQKQNNSIKLLEEENKKLDKIIYE